MMEEETNKKIKLEDLAEGEIFRGIQLIVERKDDEMMTIVSLPQSEEIQKFHYIIEHSGGEVKAVIEKNYEICNEGDENYNNFKKKLMGKLLWY